MLIVLSVLIPGCLGGEDDAIEILGTEYWDPPDAPDFVLFDQDGVVFRLSEHEGKVVVVAFVYTACPDVCLVISSNLDYVYKNLGEHSDEVVLVSITIDPARDTISHLSEWTESRGYEWPHLTGPVTELQETYRSWNVVVDNEHIAASQPPEDNLNRLVVMYPDNSSLHHDMAGYGMNGSEFVVSALSETNTSYDASNGKIGVWESNSTWDWVLHSWDGDNETWGEYEGDLSSIDMNLGTHLAWIASNANQSLAPPGADCNNHGWIMGSDTSAHCMCDEGYERPDGDWLSCIAEGSENGESAGNSVNPHDESLGEYEVGHSTTTFILDKQMRKRVAYSGIQWDAGEFLQDVISLVGE